MILKKINQSVRIRTPGGKKHGILGLVLYALIFGLFIGMGSLLAQALFKWLGWI